MSRFDPPVMYTVRWIGLHIVEACDSAVVMIGVDVSGPRWSRESSLIPCSGGHAKRVSGGRHPANMHGSEPQSPSPV